MAQKNKSRAKQPVKFAEAEKKFLNQNELCKVATCTKNIPHVTPVNFIFNDGSFYFATDYDSRKYKNLRKNKNIALAIDIYNSSIDNKAVIIQGTAEIIEKGREFEKLYNLFYEKFEWVRKDPWEEEEAPFVKVKPLHKVSWGMR